MKINYRISIFIIFFLAILVRGMIVGLNPDEILKFGNDSYVYHNMAINIVLGNGLSRSITEPFEFSSFREPGYILFIASIYSFTSLIHNLEFIDNAYIDISLRNNIDIIIVKLFQIIIGSITIVIFFIILIKIKVSHKIALLSSVILAIFPNFAYYSLVFNREVLLLFLLVLYIYFYIQYINKSKVYFLIIAGLVNGLLVLTLQVNIILVFIFPLVLIYVNKNFKFFIKNYLIYGIASSILILIFSTYVYFKINDINVYRTMGVSYTFQLKNYFETAYKISKKYGLISKEDVKFHRSEFYKPSSIHFKRSYNGYYSQKTDSLNSLVPESMKEGFDINSIFTNMRKSLFLTRYGYEEVFYYAEKYGNWVFIPIVIFPIIISLLGIVGFSLNLKKFWVYCLVPLAYLSLFNILGDEYRRMIIIQPFTIFFCVLFVTQMYNKLRSKIK